LNHSGLGYGGGANGFDQFRADGGVYNADRDIATPNRNPYGFGDRNLPGMSGPDRLGRGFGGFKSEGGELGEGFDRGGFSGPAPSVSRLNSFLGMPSDSGLSAASGHDYGMHYSGSARGLDAAAGGEAGYHGGVYHGPNGATIAHGAAGERGVAIGPDGGAAGERGARGTVVVGPDGKTVAHGEAGERGVAAGPDGIAGGSRSASGTAVHIDNGTYAHASGVTRHWSAADYHVHGNYVRNNFNHYDMYGHGWWHRYPNAWWANGFAAGFWAGASWAGINDWFGADWPAYAYAYGNDITYVDNNVCLYGEPIATAADYYQSAADLAETGEEADIPSQQPPADADSQAVASNPADAQWLPLGVFEALQPDQKTSPMTFQIAVNKDGIVRGNYFNSGDNNVQPIEGAVDKKTQRITWIVKDKDKIIFDTGLYNLTKDESTVLVHFSKDNTQQWTFVRLKQPDQSQQASTQQ